MIKVGQNKKLTYQFTNDNDAIVDLTDASITFTLGNNTTQITKQNTAAGGSDIEIKLIDATNGLFVVYLTRTDTLRLEYGKVYIGSIHVSKESMDYMKNIKFDTEKSVETSDLDIVASNAWENSTATWETI